MSEFLNEIYERVRNINEGISKYEFSKDYLDKSESYYAYLTSTNSNESANVLKNLYKNALKKAQLCEVIARKYKVRNEAKRNEYLSIAEDTLNEFKRSAIN